MRPRSLARTNRPLPRRGDLRPHRIRVGEPLVIAVVEQLPDAHEPLTSDQKLSAETVILSAVGTRSLRMFWPPP
jgi:hypothetical protein